MADINQDSDPTQSFLDTLNDAPEQTHALKVPKVVPLISRGPATGTPQGDPLGDNADAMSGGMPLEGSDAEAYAALKAKRAERRRKKVIHRAIAAGIAAAIVIGGAVTILALNHQPEQLMEPITDIAMQGTFSTTVDAKGALQPMSSTVITPEVTGQIESINVVAGQTVNEGDVLMTIKNPELDRAIAEADRALRQAKSELSAAQQALNAAKAAPTLPGDEGAMPSAGDIAGAQQAVNAAQAGVESAQAAYDDAVAKAALRIVKAPAAGSVVALNAQVGADLSEGPGDSGATGPLMQIADLSKMKVTIQVEEQDIASVAIDQTASIICPAFPDLVLSGRVASIASIASGDSTSMSYDGMGSPTFAVDVLIDAPDARLKPGMTAEVSLTTQQIDNVVMVPTSALLTDDGESYYVNVEKDAESHETERVDVEVVAKNDEFAVVGKPGDAPADANPDMPSSPLDDGDVLVIAGGSAADGGSIEDSMAAGGGMAVM